MTTLPMEAVASMMIEDGIRYARRIGSSLRESDKIKRNTTIMLKRKGQAREKIESGRLHTQHQKKIYPGSSCEWLEMSSFGSSSEYCLCSTPSPPFSRSISKT